MARKIRRDRKSEIDRWIEIKISRERKSDR